MSTEIYKEFRFEAAHRLPNVDSNHKCSRLHGHSFVVQLHVCGDVGERTGWIIDFAGIASAWAPLHAELDHRFLNEIDGLENPTSENLARWIFWRVRVDLPGLCKVVVQETCTSGVSFSECGPNFAFEALSTYDWLAGVDEAIVDGKRVKRRGTPETAERAVAATIEAAHVYHRRRDEVQGSIAYAAQGVSVEQYLKCVLALLPLIRPGRDWLALGGFCIIGMQRSLIPQFVETCRRVVPLCREHGVKRVHFLGVTVVDPLQHAIPLFEAVGVETSTDSTSMETNALMGKEWHEDHMSRWPGASPFLKRWEKESKQLNDGYHPADLAVDNGRHYSAWLAKQGAQTTGFPHRPLAPFQHSLFD